jgi:transposase-like protein
LQPESEAASGMSSVELMNLAGYTWKTRRSISIATKAEIVEAHKNGEKQSELAKRYNFSKSTVCEIIKRGDEIISEAKKRSELGDTTRKRLQRSKSMYNKIEVALYDWCRGKEKPICHREVFEKAKELSVQNGCHDFSSIYGWIDKFKSRYYIQLTDDG